MKWLQELELMLSQVFNYDLILLIEILELDLCKDDKFIVLASDGVWEFLSNEDVAAIVMPFFEKRNAEGAAEALVRESYLKWKSEEDDIIDDITCVIIFLDVKLP
jgi:serine/threonine protein phosphatase PrpC